MCEDQKKTVSMCHCVIAMKISKIIESLDLRYFCEEDFVKTVDTSENVTRENTHSTH